MQNTLIREFKKSDKPQLVKLFFEFGGFLKELDEKDLGLIIVPNDYGEKFFDRMLKDVQTQEGIIYVLEADKKAVGFIAGIIHNVGSKEDELDCKPHRMGRVIELFISKKYRGAGFGLKLMEKIGKYFKEKECYKINVEVLALNKNAYNFYKKLGF